MSADPPPRARRRQRLATVIAAWVFVAATVPAGVTIVTLFLSVDARAFSDRWAAALAVPVVALVAAAALFAWVVARHVAQPLVRLRAVAALVARARPDLSVVARARDHEPYVEVQGVLEALHRMIDATERQDADRARLAAFIAHDLRAPLGAIARTLNDPASLRDAETVGHVRKGMAAAVVELDRLVVALRPEGAPGAALDGRGVDVPALVVDVVRLLERPGRAIEVKLQRPFVTSVPEAALRSVLTNLLENADRHGTGSCRVEIDLGRVRVVNDRRDRRRTDRRIDGDPRIDHGLGLEIVRSSLTRYGGRIVVEPEQYDRFGLVVYLPVGGA
ncbi:MAG: ATP-binding protein [Trueperaceae bacterium]